MAAHTQTMFSSGKKHKLQSSTKEKDFRNIYDGGLYCLVLFWNSTKFFFFNMRELLARKDLISLDQRSKSALFSVALGDAAHFG